AWLFLSGAAAHHLSVRYALSPGAPLLEAARWHRLRRRVWHLNPRAPCWSGRRALLQRGLWQAADDRPRLHRWSIRHHGLQPRQSIHSPCGSACPEGPSHRLCRLHGILHRLSSPPDGLAEWSAAKPDDLVLKPL